jgi:hypothetical protein
MSSSSLLARSIRDSLVNCNAQTRWLWVVVATLAVAPVLALKPPPVRSSMQGPGGSPPQQAQALGHASSVERVS